MFGTRRLSPVARARSLRRAAGWTALRELIAAGLYALYFPALFVLTLLAPLALARWTGAPLVTGMQLALALGGAGYLLGFGVVFD